jgi:hypothetical protein
MERKKPRVPPLRFASVGMTISFNKVTAFRDDKGSAHLSSRYKGWTEPQAIRDFHHLKVGLRLAFSAQVRSTARRDR